MSDTVESLKAHLARLSNEGYIFHSPKDIHQPITARAIRKFFTHPKYGIFSRCGIINKSVHGFRHYNITKTLELTNGDLAKTRRRSGHSSFTMLKVYDDARLTKKDVADLEGGFRF